MILNSSCFFSSNLPDEIPDDNYIIESHQIHVDYIATRYLYAFENYYFFLDSSNDIILYNNNVDYDKISKYIKIGSNNDLSNCIVVDMTKYNDNYIITTNCLNENQYMIKIIIKSKYNEKLYKIDLPTNILLDKGLKYYENGNFFIGIQKKEINGESYGKLLKFNFDLTNDIFLLDYNYPEVLLNNISYFNIIDNGLWYYKFINYETRNEIRMNFGSPVVYYKYDIYEYDLLAFEKVNSIEFFKRELKLIDIVNYNEGYIWLLSEDNPFTIEKYKRWWRNDYFQKI